jgi:hypothetical protein
VSKLPSLGFHWKNNIYVSRIEGDVIISHVDFFNGNPSVKQWKIQVNEFASMVCAASTTGESAEQFQAALKLLG